MGKKWENWKIAKNHWKWCLNIVEILGKNFKKLQQYLVHFLSIFIKESLSVLMGRSIFEAFFFICKLLTYLLIFLSHFLTNLYDSFFVWKLMLLSKNWYSEILIYWIFIFLWFFLFGNLAENFFFFQKIRKKKMNFLW